MNAVTTNSSLPPSLLWNRVIGLSRERKLCCLPPPVEEEDLLEVYDGFGI